VKMLYSSRSMEKLKRKNKVMSLVMQLIAAASLAACILMCSITCTENAFKMELYTILTAVVSGWAVIYIYLNSIRLGTYEEAHTRLVIEGMPEGETLEGILEISTSPIRIKESIVIYSAALNCGGEKQRVSINASKHRELASLCGKRLRVLTVHGFAAAYEVLE